MQPHGTRPTVEEADGPVDAFVHVVRPRYAEVDAQGVVFNAHWLTYFDESCTRFFEWLGYEPSVAFFHEFDVMLVKAVVEWQGPAGFDERVEIAVTPAATRQLVPRPQLHGERRGSAGVHRPHHLREREAGVARAGPDPRRAPGEIGVVRRGLKREAAGGLRGRGLPGQSRIGQ